MAAAIVIPFPPASNRRRKVTPTAATDPNQSEERLSTGTAIALVGFMASMCQQLTDFLVDLESRENPDGAR